MKLLRFILLFYLTKIYRFVPKPIYHNFHLQHKWTINFSGALFYSGYHVILTKNKINLLPPVDFYTVFFYHFYNNFKKWR